MIRAGTPEDRAVARNIGDNQGICADHDVITYGDASHHLTSGTEINIIADGWPAGPADTTNAHALINCATVTNPLGENKDATAIVDNQPGSDVALPVDVDASEHEANRVSDEINRDHQLTKHRNFEAVNPAAEPIHNHCQCSKFEQRRDAFTEKSFVLGPHSVSADFTVYVGTNRFKHGDQISWATRDTREPEDVPRLWQTPRRCNRSDDRHRTFRKPLQPGPRAPKESRGEKCSVRTLPSISSGTGTLSK